MLKSSLTDDCEFLKSISMNETKADSTKSATPSFYHQAAKASWCAPLLVFLMILFGRNIASRVFVELIAFILFVSGFGLAVAALTGIRKHGKKGILVSSLAGLSINGLMLLIFISNFLAARSHHH